MKYLQFNEDGVLLLVSKTRVNEDDLEIEDSYNFQKEKEIEFNKEKITVLIDKTKDEILEELFPKLSYEELRNKEYESKLAQINANYVISINELSRGVPDTERSTWTKQEQEAKDYLSGNTDVPMLSSLAKARGVPIEYLASKIVEKASLYSTIVGELTGIRQREEDALKLEYNIL